MLSAEPEGLGVSSSQIIVSGFLGAGKTRLIEALSGQGLTLVEADGLAGPGTVGPVVTVADGVNLPACLADADLSPLIRHQIEAANLVVISRGDVADISQARTALSELTAAPILETAAIDDLHEAISNLAREPVRTTCTPSIDRDFATWTYQGPAVLTAEALEQFLAARPKGAYRIEGKARGAAGGIDVQVFGRGRQTARIDQPAETRLTARGLKSRLRPLDMDLAFSEAVVASSYRRGVIACR